MFKTTYALCVLLLAANISAQPLCPRSKDVGNFINYLHLFKEEADTLLSFYNTKTTVEVIYEDFGPISDLSRNHKIAFKVTDNNHPKSTWVYAVWVQFEATTLVIKQVYNFAKFRFLPDITVGLVTVNPNAEYLKSLFALVAAPAITSITCSQSVIKLEYDYFYYMFANYYKSGLGERKPLPI